jgi:isohexenylglutaconyl-CoA hydratase
VYDFDSLTTDAVLVRTHMGVLFVTLNRPDTRNALAPEIVQTLGAVLERLEADTSMRALVLRGNGGVFCSGGSVGNFQARLDAGAQGGDPVALRNREFGRFMQRLAALPLPTLAIVEGAAMGGGLGLACVADVVLATADARFALTETSLGIIPAQIAPYVAARVGAQTACRLGLTGERVSGETALRLRLVDELAADSDALDELLAQWLTRICSCAPNANRALKPLLQRCVDEPADVLLDAAALVFAQCMRDEGVEGIAAFRAKRAPAWGRRFSTADVQRARTPSQPFGERSA